MAALRQRVELHPNDSITRKHLAQLLFMRSQYRFDLAGQQQAIEELTYCIAQDAKNPDFLVCRAGMQQSLHRFHEAQADLERAAKIGAPGSSIQPVQQELDWNTGDYEKAELAIRDAAEQNRNTQTLARLARLEHDLGNYALSDKRFEQAEDAFTDTNPLTLAWLNVQRGICQFDRGNYGNAADFFREAIRRMPGSLSARSQLADALHAGGESDAAAQIYEAILNESQYPEFSASLASIYREMGKTKRANTLTLRATQGFKTLMQDFPEAMAGHASYFFLTDGNDPKLALQLTQANLQLRPTSKAYQALARAQLANDQVSDAAESIAIAMKMPVKSASLTELQSELQKRHPQTAK